MNQRTFFFTLKPFNSLLIHFFITFFSLHTTLTFSSVDPRFKACEPKTCGNGQNISYPFYIKGKQAPFCGYPRFELTCSNNGFPILTTSTWNTQYIIHEIFYGNQSLRVSIPAFSQPSNTVCIPLIHNFSSHSKRFSVASKQKEVLLFYDCDLTSPSEGLKENRLGCSFENRTSSVVALYREDPNLRLAWRSCKGEVVNTRVEEDEKGGIEEALKRGFMLNWTASNCGECTRSGGRCGFDLHPDTYAFRCYCPDKVHFANCDTQQ